MARSGGDVRAGGAYVEISARDHSLMAGLKRAQAKIAAFATAVKTSGIGLMGIGGAGMAAALTVAKGFADAGSAVNDMAARTGLGTAAVQELAYAAQQSGASMEDVETGVRKMQKSIAEAANGSKSAAEALGALGLSAAQLAGLSPEQQFEAIAKRLNEISDPAQKTAAALELFGKSGTKLLPMVADMAALRQQARDLYLVMGADDVAAADALGDAFDTLKSSLAAVRNVVGAALAPVLTNLAGRISTAIASVIAFIDEHRQLVVIATGVAVAMVTVGGALTAVGVVLGSLVPAVAGVGAVLGVLSSPITLVVGSLAALGGAFVYNAIEGETFAAKLASLGKLIEPAITATVDFVKSAWASAVEFLTPVWNTISAVATDTFSAIYDAVTPLVVATKDAICAAWGAVQPYIMPVLEWIRDAVITAFAAVGFTVKNWQNELAYLLVGAAYSVVRFGNEVAYQFTEVLPANLRWWADNWREIFETAWNLLKTFCSNVGTNLANLWNAIVGVFQDEGWNFEWTGLLEGFESTVKELPKIAKREIGQLEGELKQEMDAIGGELSQSWEDYRKKLAERTKAPTPGTTPNAAPTGENAPTPTKHPGAGGYDAESIQDHFVRVGETVQAKYSTMSQFGGAGLAMLGGGTMPIVDELRTLGGKLDKLDETTRKSRYKGMAWDP